MAADLIALAHEDYNFAVVVYDMFREVGNVLSGYIAGYERRAREAGDPESAAIFHEEYMELRDTIEGTPSEDIDEQERLMGEWRGIVQGLRKAA